MFVSRLDIHHRSAEYIPFLQEDPALEDVALRHLAMALGSTSQTDTDTDRKPRKPGARKARREEGGRFAAGDNPNGSWSVCL
jgi:hypothetical protein